MCPFSIPAGALKPQPRGPHPWTTVQWRATAGVGTIDAPKRPTPATHGVVNTVSSLVHTANARRDRRQVPHHNSSHGPPRASGRASDWLGGRTARLDTISRCNAAPPKHSLAHHCGDMRAAGGGALERSKGSLGGSSLTHPSTVVLTRQYDVDAGALRALVGLQDERSFELEDVGRHPTPSHAPRSHRRTAASSVVISERAPDASPAARRRWDCTSPVASPCPWAPATAGCLPWPLGQSSGGARRDVRMRMMHAVREWLGW
jgi:hypothetical protein